MADIDWGMCRHMANQPEPPPEDSVDLFCPSCDGEFSSNATGVHRMGDKEYTRYKRFVGVEHCHMEVDGERILNWYSCPKGCKNHVTEEPIRLQFHAACWRATPHHLWEVAQLYVKRDVLQREIDEINAKLGDLWAATD